MEKLLEVEKSLKEEFKKDYPEFKAGDIIKVFYKIRDKEKIRLHPVEGVVIKIQG
ncbi:MAG: 50S ribosomal protein L19, partial [Candidatus Omnitrophica bacterium]|nr:50S ribosomal protein L19 [Candidatus Omnitrophota bacterium]